MKPRPSFYTRLTGASWELLTHCSVTCRNAFNNIGVAMLITGLFSATVMSVSMGLMAFKNLWVMPLVFAFWLPFVVAMDRTMVLTNSKAARWFRALVVLVLAGFHVLVFDSLWLQDDLAAENKSQYNARITAIQHATDSAAAPLFARIASIEADNLERADEKAKAADDKKAELWGHGASGLRGRGPVLIALEGITAERNSTVDATIAANNATIVNVRSEIARINAEATININAEVKPSELGLKGALAAMFHLLLVKKDTAAIILSLFGLAIVCFFEGAPLIAKAVWKTDVSEYFDQAAKAKKRGEHRAGKFDELEMNRINAEFKNKDAQVQGDLLHNFTVITGESAAKASQAKLRFRKAEAIDRFHVLEEFLKDVGKIEEQLRQEFPDLFTEYIADEMNATRKTFIGWLKRERENTKDHA